MLVLSFFQNMTRLNQRDSGEGRICNSSLWERDPDFQGLSHHVIGVLQKTTQGVVNYMECLRLFNRSMSSTRWNELDIDVIGHLAESMPRRLTALIENQGCYISYPPNVQ
jgi:hypothetical protein